MNNQINKDDINPESTTVIHLFSNVIDLDDFDGNAVLSVLNEDKSHNNKSYVWALIIRKQHAVRE